MNARSNRSVTSAALIFAGPVLLAACAEVGAQTLAGTYVIALQQGSTVLSLETLRDGRVAGWMRAADGSLYQVDGDEVADEDGERSVEGRIIGPLGADFVLFEEDGEDTFGFLLTPHDEG